MPTRTRIPVARFIRFSTSDATIAVGDLVSISSVNDNVIRCDASNLSSMPAIGIAKSVGSSSVVVQRDYIYTLPSSSSLSIVSGDTLYASTAGSLTNTLPSSGVVQRIGSAKSSTKLILDISGILNSFQREQYELTSSSSSFTLQHQIKLNSEVVSLNGVTLHSSGDFIDYQIANNVLTINFIPDIGDVLLISYVSE
tara:strand:+ start:2883 stop:3473 length:591 start_codon:yes stop_codon:yes gene_type:complete